MRYRATYLHVPTSARLTFTVEVPLPYEGAYVGSAGEAMGWRAATKWMEQTGLATHEWVRLGIVGLTDKMSVWVG